MPSRARASFVVHSEAITGEEITRRLGIRPTRLAERGEPISQRSPDGKRREHATWELTSHIGETEQLAAHLESLLDIIEPAIHTLRQLEALGGTVRWSCLVTAKPMGNMVWIEPPLLARLTQVGAPLMLDIYDSDEE
ncbi:DUF4279 domain-containing protein [Dactylosporangium sp. NPDC051485]|uniref:DUF4279 domain-containing protein n=1 Tax=Dactylosporangium sp. NPDC051485 TaxID=3154846 RepID=UPI0034397242